MWASKSYTFSPSTTAASAEVNQNFDDAFAAINTGMPSGGIILWSGSIVSIPSGWYLCNGANSTPDLRNRFIVGAGDSYAVNDTGGAASVTLSSAQIPVHTHSGNTGYTDVNHYHNGTVDSGGVDHVHGPESGVTHFYQYDAANTNETYDANTTTGGNNRERKASNTGGASAYAHQHTFTTSWQTGGTTNHRHIFTTDNGTGGGGSHENRPPYYSLAFIMKS